MRRLRVTFVTLSLVAMLASPALAIAAAPAATENYVTLLSQINAPKGSPDRVVAATVDKAHYHVRVTLANHMRPLASYPAAEDKHLVDLLLHHNIPVIYAKPPAVHHTLRYIAAGVVAVLVLIGGGVWFYTRGRVEIAPDKDPPAARSP
jgi:hypothetical protein